MLIPLAKFIRDLLTYDEQLIRLGRQNFEREQFETAYIVVDTLAPQNRVASLEDYDGDTETQSLGHVWRGVVTIDFYGTGAYDRASNFTALIRSQTAYELQKTLGIAVYQPTTLTDVRALTGQQWGERIQIELTLEITNEVQLDVPRIDTAQIEIQTERGIDFSG